MKNKHDQGLIAVVKKSSHSQLLTLFPRFLDFRRLLNIIYVRDLFTEDQRLIFTKENMNYFGIDGGQSEVFLIERGGVNARG